jgi:hypothetical protein
MHDFQIRIDVIDFNERIADLFLEKSSQTLRVLRRMKNALAIINEFGSDICRLVSIRV